MTRIIFLGLGSTAIVAALLCITRRSPVASALWLVTTMFSLAAMYVTLDAHFIAVLQVMVYAGAIMVLFLFVIMLLNVGRTGTSDIRGLPGRVIAPLAGVLILAKLTVLRVLLPHRDLQLPSGAMDALQRQQGVVQAVAEPLFQTYMIPFQMTGILLLAATVGAVLLAKRRL